MNINNKTAKVYNALVGRVPQLLLFREVFGMTEDEANSAYQRLIEERAEADHRVDAIYVAKARNNARRRCGFREKNDDVKPMPTSGIAQLMGFPVMQSQQEPEQEEEEL